MKLNISFKDFKKNHIKKNTKFYLDLKPAKIITKLKIYLNFYFLKKIVLFLNLLKRELLEGVTQ